MDRIEHYSQLVKQGICQIASELPQDVNIRTEIICDEAAGHFELIEAGWEGARRIHGCLIHCDIRDDKIHIEHDGTDFGIADFLLEHGVLPTDIVLGFHPPELRSLTPFAVA